MKDLPRVFANKINENINNTQEIFYGNDRKILKNNNSLSIVKKINNIFASSNHVYKSRVRITLKDMEIEKVIVGKTNVNLITIDGELIKINDIIDIEKIWLNRIYFFVII